MNALKHQFAQHRQTRIIALALAGFAIVSLALFIAGAIMLGVGISKANAAAELSSCFTDSTTQAPDVSTGGGNNGGGDTGGGDKGGGDKTCPSCPSQGVQPVPYFLTLQMQNVSRAQLEQNYSATLEQLQQQVELSLPDASVITVLSISPQDNVVQSLLVEKSSEATQMDDQTQSTNASAVAIVSVIYTSDKTPTSVDIIKQQIEQPGNGSVANNPVITVSYIQNSKAPQSQTLDNQMCTQVNPKPDVVLPPGEKIYPCARLIAFVMDITDMTAGDTFKRRFDFLANTVLSDKWNHFERVGYGKFSGSYAVYNKFGTYTAYSDLKKMIDTDATQPVSKNASLITALKSLNNYYQSDGILRSAVIVFITKALKEDVDRVIRWENKGYSLKMAVTLVTVGPSQGDGARINIEQLNRLGLPIIQWENTNEDIPDWEQKFWKAYTCNNAAYNTKIAEGNNADSAEFTFESISTRDSNARTLLERIEYSQKHSHHSHGDFSGLVPLRHDGVGENSDSEPFSPCEKKIVIVYDVSTAISVDEFKKQLNFLSDKLLANNWNHFERLGLGFYGSSALLNPFKIMANAKEAKNYIQFTYQSRRNASLSTLLGALALEDMYRQKNAPTDSATAAQNISTIIFVSNPSARDIERAIPYAKQVDSYGRLTFVALKPNKVGSQQLASLVASDHVIPWDISNKDEPNNWQSLFQNAYDCTGGTDPGIREIFTPCPMSRRRIVVIADSSRNLTDPFFKKQQDFLSNSLFASDWNHFERLGLGNYNKYSWVTQFGFFNASESERERVKNSISSWSKTNLGGSLNTALADIRSKFPNNGSQPNSYIVFCSEAREKDVQLAAKHAQNLTARGRLTFVALNDVDVDRLKTLSQNIIKWNMTETNEPNDWQNEFEEAYNCEDTLPASDSSNNAMLKVNPHLPLSPCAANEANCELRDGTEHINNDIRQLDGV